MRSFGIVACGLVFLSGAAPATAQTTITRQITTEPVETIVTRGPNGTIVSRRPLNPAPPAVDTWAAPAAPYLPSYSAPVVAEDVDEPEQTVTVRRVQRSTTTRTSRVAPRPQPRRQLALSPAQRQIVYRTIVQREVYPARPAVRPVYPPVVAQTEVIEPAPRSYPLRTIYPFPNDNPYYDDAYAYRSYNYDYANSHLYDRYPMRTTYVVGSRIPERVPLVAVPDSVALQIPATRPYSYAMINGRVYLVDPATGIIAADVTQ
jgi:hypothetical protein